MADDTETPRPAGDSSSDDSVLEEAREAYGRAADAEAENFAAALEDLRFGRLGEQWPETIRKQREQEGRPCLTINRLPTFIRQVVNDARQNKPQIRCRPVDSAADIETADILNGLIRNIEHISRADTAYDTAMEFAVSAGFGYIRVAIDYACDDTFDREIRIERVANPFSVLGDPLSTSADGSDWNSAFVTEMLPRDVFKARYKGAEPVDWDDLGYTRLGSPWVESGDVLVAEWWKREEVAREILLLSNGQVVGADAYVKAREIFAAAGLTVENSRQTRSHKVTHRIMTGAEILETNEWAGRYIPIIPVYGEEVNVEGKRYFRSLIRDAKDAQRMINYWRSMATELVALAPKAPYIGPESAFQGEDAQRWASANTEAWPYLSYPDESQPPQRQPFAGVPAGALQEALNAGDDLKSIMGMYDASLGARSNETSGRAIMARQREGDVSTFHFVDNLSRAIRQAGLVIVDLIPAVYTGPRILRVLGEDARADLIPVNQPVVSRRLPDGRIEAVPAERRSELPKGVERIFDLAAGKYDVVMESGPSFTTRREEAAAQMTEMIRAYPASAPVIGDQLAKNMDWPGADIIARRLKKLLPPGIAEPEPGEEPAPPPRPTPEQMAEQQKAEAEAQKAQADIAAKGAELEIKGRELDLKEQELQQRKAESARDYDLKRAEMMARGLPVGGVDDQGNVVPTPMERHEQMMGQMAQTMAGILQAVGEVGRQAQAATAASAQAVAEINRMRAPAQVTLHRRGNGAVATATVNRGGVVQEIAIGEAQGSA